jgi:hypothetical protein
MVASDGARFLDFYFMKFQELGRYGAIARERDESLDDFWASIDSLVTENVVHGARVWKFRTQRPHQVSRPRCHCSSPTGSGVGSCFVGQAG